MPINKNLSPKDKQGISVTCLSILLNLFLAGLKGAVGIVAHSWALVGDAFHSVLDLSTDLAALFGLKMATRPEDETHHYGHYKFSSLSLLFISLVLLGGCVGLIYTCITRMAHHSLVLPGMAAIWVAAASIAVKEFLFWRTLLVARRLRSKVLHANAWHHRADSFSSLLVFVSLLVIAFNGSDWLFLDKVLGIMLGCFLGYQSVFLLYQACQDLLDAAPGKEIINDIREHIVPTPGVVGYHAFRVRPAGDLYEVDLHLQVDGDKTVKEGHEIAARVRQNILAQHEEVLDVLVHVEPAEDRHLKEKGIHEIPQE